MKKLLFTLIVVSTAQAWADNLCLDYCASGKGPVTYKGRTYNFKSGKKSICNARGCRWVRTSIGEDFAKVTAINKYRYNSSYWLQSCEDYCGGGYASMRVSFQNGCKNEGQSCHCPKNLHGKTGHKTTCKWFGNNKQITLKCGNCVECNKDSQCDNLKYDYKSCDVTGGNVCRYRCSDTADCKAFKQHCKSGFCRPGSTFTPSETGIIEALF